jgi:general secretion pathway protein K
VKSIPLSFIAQRSRQQGSALIMVLWLITMLGMIVYSMHRIVAHDLDLTIAQKQSFRARQLAEMGLNWAMNPAVKEYDTAILNQTLEDGESFSVKIRGEGGRMNMNAILQQGEASRTFLAKLFNLWGLDNDQADVLFDIMVDWTDTNSTKLLHGLEKEDYVAMYGENTPYPFNRPFYNLEEMLLVPGFDQVVANLPDWRDYFTIYSAGKVDLNEAEAKVLAAVAVALEGTSDPATDFPDKLEDAQELVVERWGPDGIEDTEDDIKFQNQDEMNTALSSLGLDGADPAVQTIFGVNDQTVHIESVATVGEYRKRVVLIVRNRTGTPQILTREEVPLFQ